MPPSRHGGVIVPVLDDTPLQWDIPTKVPYPPIQPDLGPRLVAHAHSVGGRAAVLALLKSLAASAAKEDAADAAAEKQQHDASGADGGDGGRPALGTALLPMRRLVVGGAVGAVDRSLGLGRVEHAQPLAIHLPGTREIR